MSSEAAADVRTITAQVFAAFGQGTGPLLLTSDAAQFLLEYFVPRLQKHAGQWGAIALLVSEHARQLGRISANLASQTGVTSIEPDQVRKAVEIMHASTARGGLDPCPIC